MTLEIILVCILGLLIPAYIITVKNKNKTIDQLNKIIINQVDTILELEEEKEIIDNKVVKLRNVFPFPYHKDVDEGYRGKDSYHVAEITHSPEFCLTAMTRLCKEKSLVFYNSERRSGNTTRLVDLAIQDIFNGKTWKATDHHKTMDSNKRLFKIVLDRLLFEHVRNKYAIKSIFNVDYQRFTISLTKQKTI